MRPRGYNTVVVQIAIAADSLFDPFRALTVFRTDFTHRLNLEDSRVRAIVWGYQKIQRW